MNGIFIGFFIIYICFLFFICVEKHTHFPPWYCTCILTHLSPSTNVFLYFSHLTKLTLTLLNCTFCKAANRINTKMGKIMVCCLVWTHQQCTHTFVHFGFEWSVTKNHKQHFHENKNLEYKIKFVLFKNYSFYALLYTRWCERWRRYVLCYEFIFANENTNRKIINKMNDSLSSGFFLLIFRIKTKLTKTMNNQY